MCDLILNWIFKKNKDKKILRKRHMNPSWIELKNQVLGDLQFSAHFLILLSFVYIFLILVNIHNKEYSRCSYFNDY